MDERKSLIIKDGLPFVCVAALVGIAGALMGFSYFAFFCMLIALFCAFFFRNPERHPPQDPRILVSPADGRVLRIDEVDLSEPMRGKYQKISIFMNVFNVHVNRVPYSGRVDLISYRKGKFLSANLDKASEDNERNSIVIRTDDGRLFMTVQIAGIIARRIICWISEGMQVHRGDRFGLICFGSRLEVFLPAGSEVLVRAGQKVRAGETPIGHDHEK